MQCLPWMVWPGILVSLYNTETVSLGVMLMRSIGATSALGATKQHDFQRDTDEMPLRN